MHIPPAVIRVMYVVVCGAPRASEVHEFMRLARASGWDVQVNNVRQRLTITPPPCVAVK
jgi:hypothetical protein